MVEEAADRLLDDAVLVVAHPDDEVLWFSGILGQVRRVIICFGPVPVRPWMGLARARARERHPLSNITWLELPEPGVAADWTDPTPAPHGLRLRSARDRRRYHAACQQLEQVLSQELGSHRTLITHNPWGDYGHEDHVLVHRATAAVAQRLGQRLWFSNYCSPRSSLLAYRCIERLRPMTRVVRKTDLTLMQQIKEIYLDEMCWTWPRCDNWFAEETYYELADASLDPARMIAGLALNCVGSEPPAGGWLRDRVARMTSALQPAWSFAIARIAYVATRPFLFIPITYLKSRLGMKSRPRLRMPDRHVLEKSILPHLAADENITDILFVGVDWYTSWYREFFATKRFRTIDIDPRLAAFGSKAHIVGDIADLGTHLPDGSQDAIVLNGLVGFGLNDMASIERAITSCWHALRPGGRLILGWNNVARFRPVRLEDVSSLRRFAPWNFPPLAVARHAVQDTLMRHVFDFYLKEART